ncbi:MAG: hypothetical protein ACRDRH_15800 [Pseudonocardia sp.]
MIEDRGVDTVAVYQAAIGAGIDRSTPGTTCYGRPPNASMPLPGRGGRYPI